MEWLITVIVIVLIVAIVWWLLSRNRAKTPSDGIAPSSPSQTASSPQIDTTAAALTGSAPLVAAAATAEQLLAESRSTEPEPEPEPSPEPGGVDVDDWERPGPPLESEMAAQAESTAAETAAEEPLTVEEPLFEEPTLPEPVLSEEVAEGTAATGAAVSETAVSGETEPIVPEPIVPEPVLSEPELEEGVTADDVATADDGPSAPHAAGSSVASGTQADAPAPATPEQLADSAEWEATWSEVGAPAAPVPVHHREYTDAHAPTLPGAESAAAEIDDTAPDHEQGERQEASDAVAPPTAAAGPEVAPGDATALGGHLAADQPYGEGSAAAGADGSGPDGYTVKGNADTMIYHDEDSPSYDEVKAGVWFVSSAHAEAAGFRPPRRNRR
ncbi:sunset domain-containing protein [Arthrobacter sp. MMS24-S77]